MKAPLHFEFKHKSSNAALWLDHGFNHVSVDPQLWDVESVPTPAQAAFNRLATTNSDFEIRMCMKHCGEGQITKALHALNQLVQQGCHIPNNVFYRVLKRCTAQKDLVLGRLTHALAIKSGYEGNAFLATHLIGLYASHGRLEEAMRVFAKVSAPDTYSWSAIIFAYARHGEPTHAIRLYQQMLESSVKPNNHVFLGVLKACATAGDLAAGKDVHAHVLASEGRADIFVQTCLVDMYVKCGSIQDARAVFDTMPQRNVVTWTTMIAGYAQQGMGEEALGLYNCMRQEGMIPPDSVTFACLLQACASRGGVAMHQGKVLHAHIRELGLQNDVAVGASLVNMYAKCGRVEDARRVFDMLAHKNVVTWNSMIAGYGQEGMVEQALSLYCSMQQEGSCAPTSVTIVCLLRACASLGEVALHQGKQLHALSQEQGVQDDVVVGGSLVNMYSKCGSIEDARRVFDRLPQKNVVTWTAMITGYSQQGLGQEALKVYSNMQHEGITLPNSVCFVCLLHACSSAGEVALHQGKQLHAEIEEHGLKDDVVIGSSLVNMYAKCGSIEDARILFDSLPHRDVVTWNALIAGYAHHKMGKEALGLFWSMQTDGTTAPDSVTFVCLLQVCEDLGEVGLHQGKQVHAQIEERGLQEDTAIGVSLVNMYANFGSMEEARKVFDSISHRNVMVYNAMIAGYAKQGMGEEALSLCSRVEKEGIVLEDCVTFVCLLQACATVGEIALRQGKELHAKIEERLLQNDVVIGGSLVHMYAQCGSLDDARRVFDRLPCRNVVTWTAMISGYVQQGMGEEALSVYRTMLQEGVTPPDSVIFVCLLRACSSLAALPSGKHLHAQIEQHGFQDDVTVGVALVHMYAKCGSMFDARQVFDSLLVKNIKAWNALIAGYAQQGDGEVVFGMLDRMRTESVQPDGTTLLHVMTVCSHLGLVDTGLGYFESMSTDYGIAPTMEHYTCMMDLLSRAGYLDEVLGIAKSMPFPPDGAAPVWVSLLSACRKWNNVEIGRQAFEFAVGLDDKNSAFYVLMSSIYAGSEMWVEAKEIQARRVISRAWKPPGQSWLTDMDGVVYTFLVGDNLKKHPESEDIYARLEDLS